MCNYLYYWVTVRNSQSYWHLETHGGNTGMYTGRGGRRGGGGRRGHRSDVRGGNTSEPGWGGGSGGVTVCGGGEVGYFLWHQTLLHCFCLSFFLSFFFFKPFLFTSKSCISLFYSFGLWRIIVKNNTSCCECTSNNQTSIVLLCHNVQYIFIYL